MQQGLRLEIDFEVALSLLLLVISSVAYIVAVFHTIDARVCQPSCLSFLPFSHKSKWLFLYIHPL